MALSETLKAVSDPVRREILQLLRHNPLSAGQIAAHFDITQAAVSRHLSVLKKAGLVRAHRKGKEIHYELNASVLDELVLWIETLKKTSSAERKQEGEQPWATGAHSEY